MFRNSGQALHRMLRRFIGWVGIGALFLSFAYLPIDTPLTHGSISAAVVVHKDARLSHPVAKSGPPQSLPRQAWTADFSWRFLKVDRKQNLRLWPVIYTGLTRSPPPGAFV